ncbi:MAG: flagellar biosynthesis protein FlhB [Bacillota bacterium]
MSQQGGDKTEKATPKKRREAREKGQVFKSTELATALSLIALFGALSILGSSMMDRLGEYMTSVFGAGKSLPETLTISTVQPLMLNAVLNMFLVILPVLGVAFMAGLVFNYLQVGFLFSTKAMAPKFSRINMLEGFKRIFSKNTLIELLKSLIKLAVLGYIAYTEYQEQVEKVPRLMQSGLTGSIVAMVNILFGLAFKLGLALAVLGPLDFLYQWWKYEKDLRMSKQEIKDEYKLTEGDPQIKGKIRQKQRQMSSLRMMRAVAQADVVITNPTHYAVALAYEEGKHSAPLIVAKGKDLVAQRIREKARENHVEIVENKPLAQQLYFFCEVGDEVPEKMYQAVAEILAYIYRMKNKTRG